MKANRVASWYERSWQVLCEDQVPCRPRRVIRCKTEGEAREIVASLNAQAGLDRLYYVEFWYSGDTLDPETSR